MNDRIEQLKNEAVGFYMKYPWSTMDQQDLAIFSEKFAELIIRECAESLWTEECNTSDLALEEFKKNSKKIKEHFGVE